MDVRVVGMGVDIHTRLSAADPDVFSIIENEAHRQRDHIQLIASENMVSRAVLDAQGSIMTNKYAEGYPKGRYYSGCQFHDEVETLAINRLCEMFGCRFANVQPHSGSQANQAVLYSLLSPGDKILGMSLDSGGHLTHGAKPNLSGKWFNSVQYTVHPKTHIIDMDQVEEMAIKHKPKLIICGSSAYPRVIDFPRFRRIADMVGAYLLADIAHYSGLIATHNYPSPVEHADVVTSTTHKTLRGPRGGVIMTNDAGIYKKVNSALFPGIQGGPLMHVIAAKAVAFGECLKPEFSKYCKTVIANARTLADVLNRHSYKIITGGTDSHLILVDLREKNLKGNVAVSALERSGIICNKNAVPFDTESPMVTSGLRIGTPFETSRGMTETNFSIIGEWIHEVLSHCPKGADHEDCITVESKVKEKVLHLCNQFAFYQ